MIERAYTEGESLGLTVWCEDEAGPFQTVPYAGQSWSPQGEPERQAHEYIRNGTAKMLTLFHPADGQVRVKGVESSCNEVLHPWMKEELTTALAALPEKKTPPLSPEANRLEWESWIKGLSQPVTLPKELPPLQMLCILDNLKGHKSEGLVSWFFQNGIMPLYTPLGGSWLNMSESIQRILKRRALEGQHPTTPAEIITWLEGVGRGWNAHPTPFHWGGQRKDRRDRSRQRRHALGGSGACTLQPIRRRKTLLEQWL